MRELQVAAVTVDNAMPAGVVPVAFARAGSAGPTCSLAGRGLGDGGDHQRVHANLAVVHLLLGKAGVHHIVDAVNGERGLSNVGGDDALSRTRGRRVKDPGLLLVGQGGVDGQDDELWDCGAQALHALKQNLGRGVNLLLTSQKQQHITLGLSQVGLHGGDESCIHVIALWGLSV